MLNSHFEVLTATCVGIFV